MPAPGGSAASPRFSIVVPVFKVQGYLRACLDSVLAQTYADFEVVAVDDRSPDGSGAILDEYAARDPRVVPLHLPENKGIGNARNEGVAQARGDYLLFLDSDDTLLPDALESIAARIKETEEPDILVYDYARTFWWGEAKRNRDAEVLAAPGPEVGTIADRPDLLRLFTVVWNKAYRRDFYLAGGFSFPDGFYEDAVVVYESLFSAERIALLDQVCVHYRQRRQGNALRTPSRAHFAAFATYERLFAFIEERPALHRWRAFLFEHMIDHYLFILARPDRVPQAARPEFFRLAAQHYRRYRPADFVRPKGVMGVQYDALARGSYAAFAALKLAARGRKKAAGRLKKAKHTLGKQAYARFYQLQLRRPLDPHLAVYAAYWNRTPACNPLAIYEKAKELAPQVHGVWVIKQGMEETLPEGVDHVIVGSPRYWEVMARATYLVNNVNFADAVVKRPGQIHLQTHHGTPLKRMGIDQQQYPAAAKGMSMRKLLQRADRWDFSVSSNQHTTEQWERVYPCAFQSLDTGYPRNDVYYRATAQDVLEIRERLGIAPGRTAVLYAPTVRDYQNGYIPRMDLERVTRELGPDVVLLVRTHYFYGENDRLAELQEQGLLIDVSRHPSVEELCLAADALVTDYSSIMFDYANLDRPIITYADDWDVYVKSRGVTFDLLSGEPGDTPGVVATSEDELIAAFRDGTWNGAEAAARRAAFRARFCQWDDGHAAERVVRRVFLGQEETPAVLPLDERTVAPTPREAAAIGSGLTTLPVQTGTVVTDNPGADATPSDMGLAG
ncbi:CDP-glycerol glycerophosphotransferase family protein [Streptomyces sp. NPDC053560]|uniref:bifunctional glycosyltransferase/CDP-glycerol:glycerophosphate glycerophosphotransferase n=1 Tax=Streptomyces sp. NPDC053560 TaxID=3365711 RepID=UPI0037D704F5